MAKPKRKRDIPSRLDEAFIKNVCSLIRMGNYYSVACERNGVSPQLASVWRKKGGSGDFDGTQYHRLFEEVSRAESEFECLTVARINQHGNLNPNQLQWLLKNRFPERWGDKTQVEHLEGPPTIDTSNFTDEELFQFSQLCLKGKRA